MKELVIISGKGGTGKTSLTAAFSSMATNHLLCDADVDAADLHLLCAPQVQEKYDFMGGSLAEIRRDDCHECGICRDNCHFGAISEDYQVDPVACEGCGVCVHFCPEKAIDFNEQKCGDWFVSKAKSGPMVHARLGVAQENSGKLVHTIRQKSSELAEKNSNDLVIIDGPPGIGCPVIAAITGVTAALLVVEPTVSGVHDMKRAMGLLHHFSIPSMVLVNKADINKEVTQAIQNEARIGGVECIGELGFNTTFVEAMIEGRNVCEHGGDGELINNIRKIWQKVEHFVDEAQNNKNCIPTL